MEDEEKRRNEEQKNEEIIESDIKNIKPLENTSDKKDKKKKVDRRTVVIIVITVIISILVIVATVFLVLYKMKLLDDEYAYKEDEDVFEAVEKKEDPDKIYVLNDTDRINYNDIKLEEHYVCDGEVFSELQAGRKNTNFVQISGLSDSTVEENINRKLLDAAMEENQKESDFGGETDVHANFSNIFSVSVGDKIFNIDLNTGNEIKFEELFTRSAPIYAMLYDAFLHAKAWDIEFDSNNYASAEEYQYARSNIDMNERDTSGYEEYLYKIKEEYEKNKDNIRYYIMPAKIVVLGFDKEGIYHADGRDKIEISTYTYRDYITLYKKYVKSNIYKSDVAIDNVRPMTLPMSSYISMSTAYKNREYYSETDNLMIDIGVSSEIEDTKVWNGIKSYYSKYVDLANSDKDNYYVVQVSGYYDKEDSKYLQEHNIRDRMENQCVSCSISVVKIPIEYVNKLPGILAETSNLNLGSADPNKLERYVSIFKPDYMTTIDNNYHLSLYFDMNGSFLGDDVNVIKIQPPISGQS